MVLADGSFVKASESENDDLFWALRGGGGNFGVVTSFTFRLHPVHTVRVGITLWPVEQTADVLRWYREFLPQAPEDLYGFFAVLMVPPAPPFPEEIHLQPMCGIVWCSTGDPDDAEAFAPAREAGAPAFEFAAPMPYPALQTMFDGLYPPGHQWYWRGDFFDRITDEAIDAHLKFATVPTMHSTMHLYPIDGAPSGWEATTPPGATGRPPGRGSSPGSTPTPPTPRRSRTGAWSTGRRCTPTPWAAPTSTS